METETVHVQKRGEPVNVYNVYRRGIFIFQTPKLPDVLEFITGRAGEFEIFLN